MINTNNTQPAPVPGPTRDRIVTTNKLEPRRLAFTPQERLAVEHRGLLQTADLEEIQRLKKRAEVKAQAKKSGRPKKAR